MKKRIIIFISGSGSNMEALINACADPAYPAKVVAVLSDNANAKGNEKAKKHNIPVHVLERKAYQNKSEHEDAILEFLNDYNPDFICLAGFMCLLSGKIISPFRDKILNIHPSLLPLFKGLHTHQRALDAKMKIAGCTVHLVTEGMDEGEIIAQAAIPILPNDNSELLSSRVLKIEHQLYPKALESFINNNRTLIDDKQQLLSY